MALSNVKGRWALILGASSGFGEAIALKLASLGMNIAGVHLDRKGTLPHVEEVVGKIRGLGSKALYFNANAADAGKRADIIQELSQQSGGGIHCLVHSLAFGSLKPFIGEAGSRITQDQMNMTLDVMANSLVYWTQDLMDAKQLRKGSRIYAMTSSGSTRVWPTYGAVSSAKAALESHCRQLALELAPWQVSVNAVRAGVTDTPALRKIPGNEEMVEIATKRNPWGRLTTPQDVADTLALLVHDEGSFLTGNVLGIDGGEDIVG
ncbi:SDR family oxidoreductase [bacterium]|nr:SDR family oxidoreductase [bacterium]